MHHSHHAKTPSKSIPSRSVSGPAAASGSSYDAGDSSYGPYTANEPSVYLELLKNSTTPPATKCQYINCLVDSVKIYSEVDPVSTWSQASHLLARTEHVSVRLAALELLRICISAFEPSVFDKQLFYASILDYEVDLDKCTDDEIGGLHKACAVLCRGGRDITGLEDLVETLCDYAGEMFKRRQDLRDQMRADFFKQNPELSRAFAAAITPAALRRLSPLQDPAFVATFVSYPPPPETILDDAAMGPIVLLTNIHKFSWPHLKPADVSFATSYLVLEALATFHDVVVSLVIDHIDVMSRYGYVPPEQIESVIFFLARVVSLEGRGRTISYVDAEGRPTEPHVLPFSTKLCDKTRMVVKNLLKSSANQALRCLRSGTTPPGPSDQLKDVQVVVGCLTCLRDVLNEIRSSPSYRASEVISVSSTFFDSWPILLAMGLPLLFPNLCDALLWPNPEVVEQVLLLLFDRLTHSTAEVAQPASSVLSKTAELDLAEGSSHLAYDEWDLVLDLLERAMPHIRKCEDDMDAVWVLDLTPALSTGSFLPCSSAYAHKLVQSW
jgi:hypothetical protein